MSHIVDLRKVNIKTEQDVLDFLELFVTKAPQIIGYIKNQRLKNSSLQNRLDHALKQGNAVPAAHYDDPNVSVLDRMAGKGKTVAPAGNPAQTRLEQMRGAAGVPTPQAAAGPVGPTPSDLPPAPVQPGEIGQLNVPTVGGQAPNTTASADLPPAADQAQRAATEAAANAGAPAPDSEVDDPNSSSATSGDIPTVATTNTPEESSGNSEGTGVSEEQVVQAAGSKSERSTDDDLQPEDTSDEGQELSDEEKAALQAPATPSQSSPAPKKSSKKKRNKKK